MCLPGHVPVDEGDDAEAVSGGGEGGDVAVLEGTDLPAAFGGVEETVEQGVGGPEVEYGDGAGFAVDPAGLDDSPIGTAMDDVALKAGHLFCVYIKSKTKSIGNVLARIYAPVDVGSERLAPGLVSQFCVYGNNRRQTASKSPLAAAPASASASPGRKRPWSMP